MFFGRGRVGWDMDMGWGGMALAIGIKALHRCFTSLFLFRGRELACMFTCIMNDIHFPATYSYSQLATKVVHPIDSFQVTGSPLFFF